MEKNLEFRALNDGFGKEVVGIDLWTDLETSIINKILAALSTVGVLVFRRQSLSEDELVAFSEKLGELEIIVRTDWRSNVRPEVIHLSNLKDAGGNQIGRPGSGDLQWHSDQSYRAEPATGTILYAVEVPTEGGNTYFANLRFAYDKLPPNLKERIDGKRAIFSYARRVSGYGNDENKLTNEMKRNTPDISHALVQTHPVEGWRSLYIDPSAMTGIESIPDREAEDILGDICAHAEIQEFVYRHDWQVGDVVMWDNGFTIHRRDLFDARQRRFLKRTSVRLNPDRHIVPD